jgi:DNA-binding response OmpR family regulator
MVMGNFKNMDQILVVEDEPKVARFLAEGLTEVGYEA